MFPIIRTLRQGIAPALIAVAFVGCLFSQTFRLAEEIPGQPRESRRYSVVLDCGLENSEPVKDIHAAHEQAHRLDAHAPQSGDKQNKVVLVFKPLTDHWDLASGYSYQCAEVSQPAAVFFDVFAFQVLPDYHAQPFYFSHSPPVNSARGPPATA